MLDVIVDPVGNSESYHATLSLGTLTYTWSNNHHRSLSKLQRDVTAAVVFDFLLCAMLMVYMVISANLDSRAVKALCMRNPILNQIYFMK